MTGQFDRAADFGADLPPVAEAQFVRQGRYAVTVKRCLGKDWTFVLTGTLVAIRCGGRKLEFLTDQGVKAEVWKNTIIAVDDSPQEEAA